MISVANKVQFKRGLVPQQVLVTGKWNQNSTERTGTRNSGSNLGVLLLSVCRASDKSEAGTEEEEEEETGKKLEELVPKQLVA